MLATVHPAKLKAAVLAPETLEADTLAIHAAALVLAVIRTLGLGAVAPLPARLTHTAAGVRAVVAMAAAVGLSPHLT